MASSITVLIASAKPGSRKVCQDLLDGRPEVRIVGEAKTGLQTLAVVGMLKPRILLLDLSLSEANGRSLVPAIRQRHGATRVILLTRPQAESQTLDALSMGAHGYLTWDVVPTFLPAAVRAVDAGEAWVPRKMVAQLMDRLVAFYAGGPSQSAVSAPA